MKTNYPKHFALCLVLLTLACVPTASALYNPTAGRWLSRDPIGLPGGFNDYAFARNNGINHIDLYGQKCCECVTDIHIEDEGPYNADPIIGEHIYGNRFKVWITLERKGCGKLYPASINWWESSDVKPAWELPGNWWPYRWINEASGTNELGPRINSDTFTNWRNRRTTCPDTETFFLQDNPGQDIGFNKTLHILVQIITANECNCRWLLKSVSLVQTLRSTTGPPPEITEQTLTIPDPDPPR